jgi:hypothetical protein
VLRAAGYRRMTRSPLDQSGSRYGGGLTILEFFAEPCGAHMRLMRQCLDYQTTLLAYSADVPADELFDLHA